MFLNLLNRYSSSTKRWATMWLWKSPDRWVRLTLMLPCPLTWHNTLQKWEKWYKNVGFSFLLTLLWIITDRKSINLIYIYILFTDVGAGYKLQAWDVYFWSMISHAAQPQHLGFFFLLFISFHFPLLLIMSINSLIAKSIHSTEPIMA